jgi:MerR family transcriptional regulator, light-induced transcriptional regulator
MKRSNTPIPGLQADVMKKSASPKQVARAIGVSESTLKRWCDRGLIPMTKTAGGHRKIETEAVLQFLRESGRTIAAPELLGLPVTAGKTEWTLSRATDRIVTSLVNGEEAVARQIVFDLVLADHSMTAIFDDVLATVMHRIGEQWGCGEVAVYQERRACEICMRLLRECRQLMPVPASVAPVAIGATIENDFYTLPVTMAEIVLRSVGWKANSLGSNLPFDTLQRAVTETRPRLLWLSVSFIQDEAEFIQGVNDLFTLTTATGSAFAIGGQALTSALCRQLQYSAYCQSFRDLEMFARSLNPIDTPPTPPALDR